MSGRDIDQLLDAWMELGPEVAPARVAEAVRLEARSTRQTAMPVWTVRRMFAMNTMVRVAAAAALVGLGIVLGVGALGPDVGGVPSPTPPLTPVPLPEGSSRQSGTLRNQLVRTAFEVSLPPDSQLRLMPSDFGWLIEIGDTSGPWGIKLADVTGATNHTERFTNEPMPAGNAAELLDALDAASYTVSDIDASTIDGRAALVATIGLDVGADDHLDVNGSGGMWFDMPNTTYITDVDGAIIMVQVWAETETELAANRSLADSIVASLRLAR